VSETWGRPAEAPRLARLLSRPGPNWAAGGALSVLLFALQAAAFAASEPAERPDFNWFRALSLPLLSGYLLGAIAEGVRAATVALENLGDVLDLGAEETRAVERRLCAPRRGALWGVLAFGLGLPLALGALLRAGPMTDALAGMPSALYLWLAATCFWTLAGVTVAYTAENARIFQWLAREHLRVDLFHPEPLRPFGRLGLRLALLVLGVLAIVVLLLATPGAGQAWLVQVRLASGVPAIVPLLGGSALFASAAFLLPMVGVRRRIQQAKAEALARIREALGSHEEAVRARGEEAARRAQLLQLRAEIAAAPEWPVDGSMRLRFGLYLTLPALSWAAQALAEQALERLVG
jgi:hypothetical protein